MTLAGWYPDPSGDYEYRYWTGHEWTESVGSFGQAFTDPLVEPLLPGHEQALWSHGANHLTTYRVLVDDGSRRPTELALWMVTQVEVTINAGQHLLGTGRIALRIDYPGYTGRSHAVMKGIPQAHNVGALIRKWVNRNRRAAGGPS